MLYFNKHTLGYFRHPNPEIRIIRVGSPFVGYAEFKGLWTVSAHYNVELMMSLRQSELIEALYR